MAGGVQDVMYGPNILFLLTNLLILQLTTSPAQQNRFPQQQQQLQSARFPSFPSLETQQLGQQQVRSAHFGLILSLKKKRRKK
jgi:hypothetical protein